MSEEKDPESLAGPFSSNDPSARFYSLPFGTLYTDWEGGEFTTNPVFLPKYIIYNNFIIINILIIKKER